MAQNIRSIPCDICDRTNGANSFCVNFKQNYCDNFKKGHLRSASCKHHKFLSIADRLHSSRSQGDTCPEHREISLFFCKTCRQMTCSVCITDKHKKHDFGLTTEMASGARDKFDKSAARKETEIEFFREQMSMSDITTKHTENLEKNIYIIKETVKDWMNALKNVEKELINKDEKETAGRIKRDKQDARDSKVKGNECLKALNELKDKLRTCNDAALLKQESEISRQLATIVIPTPPIYDQSLPTISMRRPTQDAIRTMLGINRTTTPHRVTTTASSSRTTAVCSPPNLVNSLQAVGRFKLKNRVFDIATLPGSRAWIAIQNHTLLVDINGRILVHTTCRSSSIVSALSNGDALYTSSDNVISRVDQTGRVSTFVDLKTFAHALLTVNDYVFVATDENMLKLDQKGRKIQVLDCSVISLTLMPGDRVATIDQNEHMMIIQASDSRVLRKTINLTIGSKATPSGTSFTADKHGRIIRGHARGKTIHVFQLDEWKSTRVKYYSVDMLHSSIFALDIDDSGNLWIGTDDGEVILTKYYQSD